MKSIFIYIFLFTFLSLSGQNIKLANQYRSSGEFEKAAILYKKIYEKNKTNSFYFDKYISCLIDAEKYKECNDALATELKTNPSKLELYITQGKVLEAQYLEKEAQEKYLAVIDKLPAKSYAITRISNSFIRLAKYDLATKTLERGIELLNDEKVFAYNLADLYRRKGQDKKMISYYLLSIKENPRRVNAIKSTFQRSLSKESFSELQAQLYTKIQETEDNTDFIDLLAWVFIQNKDYKGAIRQVKIIDKKLDENGGRIYKICQTAQKDAHYDEALKGYEFIVSNKSESSSYYFKSKQGILQCLQSKIISSRDYTDKDISSLDSMYQLFIDELGFNKKTSEIIRAHAHLKSFYQNDLDAAIDLLNKLISLPDLPSKQIAEIKLDLGDYYLMKKEIWESTLLYSQVDKDFSEDIIGHEARLRNAKLSYYIGDFQWAQAQFDILKASTSKLIANDAIDMSVFIMDNMGMDTSISAMKYFAEAELLIFQNQNEAAFQKLDSLSTQFKEHKLIDDILYVKAKVYESEKNYEMAEKLYLEIIENHFDEIKADNAMMSLGLLYENQLNKKEQAIEIYERIFIDKSNSTFAIEARKRFRKLKDSPI